MTRVTAVPIRAVRRLRHKPRRGPGIRHVSGERRLSLGPPLAPEEQPHASREEGSGRGANSNARYSTPRQTGRSAGGSSRRRSGRRRSGRGGRGRRGCGQHRRRGAALGGCVGEAVRLDVVVRVAVGVGRGEGAFVCEADGVQLAVGRGRAADVVPRVHKGRQRRGVRLGEAVVLAGGDELLDKVADLGLVQVHESVDVGGRQGSEARVEKCLVLAAAVDFAKDVVPMSE